MGPIIRTPTGMITDRKRWQASAPGRMARYVLLGALGMILAVQVVVEGMTEKADRLGLYSFSQIVQPGSAAALSGLAEHSLSARDYARARSLAAAALSDNPLNVKALRVQGLALALTGHEALSRRYLSLASSLSWRDSPTHLWLLDREIDAGNYDGAVDHADSLLRRSRHPEVVIATLATAAKVGAARAVIVDRLAAQPPWREPFLQSLSAAPASEQPHVLALLRALAQTSSPPTRKEAAPIVRAAFAKGDYSQAIALYESLFATSGQPFPLVRNGNFETHINGTSAAWQVPPFEWFMTPSAGATVDVTESPDGNGKSLLIDYDGYSNSIVGEQALVLPEGKYRLSYRFQSSRALEQDLVDLIITCIPSGRELTRHVQNLSSAGQWHHRSTEFSIGGAGGCRAQRLSLSLQGGSRRANTVLWLDDVQVSRVPTAH